MPSSTILSRSESSRANEKKVVPDNSPTNGKTNSDAGNLKIEVEDTEVQAGLRSRGGGESGSSNRRRSTEAITGDDLAEAEAGPKKRPLKPRCHAIMQSITLQLISAGATFYALYVLDLVIAIDHTKDWDLTVGWLTLIVFIYFTCELFINWWCEPFYDPRSVYWWLDFVSAFSLLADIPQVETLLFGTNTNIARAGRAARAGTRVGRILKLVRLIRVFRVVTLLNKVGNVYLSRQRDNKRKQRAADASNHDGLADINGSKTDGDAAGSFNSAQSVESIDESCRSDHGDQLSPLAGGASKIKVEKPRLVGRRSTLTMVREFLRGGVLGQKNSRGTVIVPKTTERMMLQRTREKREHASMSGSQQTPEGTSLEPMHQEVNQHEQKQKGQNQLQNEHVADSYSEKAMFQTVLPPRMSKGLDASNLSSAVSLTQGPPVQSQRSSAYKGLQERLVIGAKQGHGSESNRRESVIQLDGRSIDLNEDSHALAFKISRTMITKAVFGVLAVIMVVPFLTYTESDLSKTDGLELLDALAARDGGKEAARCATHIVFGVNTATAEHFPSHLVFPAQPSPPAHCGGKPDQYSAQNSSSDSSLYYVLSSYLYDQKAVIVELTLRGHKVLELAEKRDGLRERELELICTNERGAQSDDKKLCSEAASDAASADALDGPQASFAVFSARAGVRAEAVYAMWITSLVIVMLGIGAWLFNRDASTLASEITFPLQRIGEEMVHISQMDLDLLRDQESHLISGVSEVKFIQSSFDRMKVGIASFAKFTPLQVVRQQMMSGVIAQLGVRRQSITIFFSDIANFTTICESMAPKQLLEMLSEYFEAMDEIIQATNGILAEFIGDAILALWNCPQPVQNHTLQCVHAAVLMQEALARLRPLWKAEGYPGVHIRIGIHVAQVFVGNIGSNERMKYGVLGDGVNLASRLEELNKMFCTDILLSGDALDEEFVSTDFNVRQVGLVVVKGRKTPTALHQVLGRRTEPPAEPGMLRTGDVKDPSEGIDQKVGTLLVGPENNKQREVSEIQNRAWRLFLSRRFAEAEDLFKKVIDIFGSQDIPSVTMRDKAKEYAKNPPPAQWNGVDIMKSKSGN